MKCIQDTESGKVERVSDQEAAARVGFKGWRYVPKSVWRKTQPTRPSQGGKVRTVAVTPTKQEH